MSKRKAIPARVQVSVAINQGVWYAMACPLCNQVVAAEQPRILEHMTPWATMVALGKDPDEIDNLRWVHAECAAKKTNGTKATTAGSDKHMIAKGKRIAKAQEVHKAVVDRVMKRPAGKIKSRPFPKLPKNWGKIV